MSYDFTHIEYLDKDKAGKGGKGGSGNTVTIGSVDDLKNLTDLGIPMISKPNT